MTRINCIPPSELHAKHLVAEYRELPRVFTLATKAFQRESLTAFNKSIPAKYLLGTGHVRFFYNKLGYLHIRFHQLVEEMRSRGFSPSSELVDSVNNSAITFPSVLYNDWEPTLEAQAINRERIADRLPK